MEKYRKSQNSTGMPEKELTARMRAPPLFLLFLLLPLPIFSTLNHNNTPLLSSVVFQGVTNQNEPTLLLPVYVRLQVQQRSNVTFWESIPQNFTDHVGTIDSRVLAMFISSNSLGLNLSRDRVGNLWIAANYSVNAGDYLSTLIWVSSRSVSEDLTPPGVVQFPGNYPDDVKVFLEPGRKIPARDRSIQEIAVNYNQTQNMTQTVKNVLDFVTHQEYDAEKTRLLMSGNLNTTDVLDFFKNATEARETNSSMCLERAWYAAAILRAAGVPTRTVTDVRLKTWIQVWLGDYGWVDAESLCVQPPPRFPRPLSSSTPWMIENSSDAAFPFTWLPKVPMRIANLTFADVDLFNVNEYRTVLSEPVEEQVFRNDPTKFSFPIILSPEIVYAALTRENSRLTFSIIKGNENASITLNLGEPNIATLGDTTVSFKPISQGNFLILQDFAVRHVWKFDFRILVPIVGTPLALVLVWFYRRRRSRGR